MRTSDDITYRRDDIIKILRDLNTMVVSLDRIGSCYEDVGQEANNEILADFIDNWQILLKLAEMRHVLSTPFRHELEDGEDMDELEREMQDVSYWSLSNRNPPS